MYNIIIFVINYYNRLHTFNIECKINTKGSAHPEKNCLYIVRLNFKIKHKLSTNVYQVYRLDDDD